MAVESQGGSAGPGIATGALPLAHMDSEHLGSCCWAYSSPEKGHLAGQLVEPVHPSHPWGGGTPFFPQVCSLMRTCHLPPAPVTYFQGGAGKGEAEFDSTPVSLCPLWSLDSA